MKTLRNTIACAIIALLTIASAQAGETVFFNTILNPAPTVTSQTVNYNIYINNDADAFKAMSFEITVDKSLTNLPDIVITHYGQSGDVLTEEVAAGKSIVASTSVSVTYRFVILAKDGVASKYIHQPVGGSTDLYKLFNVAFKKTAGGSNYSIGYTLIFTIANIKISKNTGNSFFTVLKEGTNDQTTQTISHTFRSDGDINDDGAVDVLDLMMVVNHILNISYLAGSEFQRADVNNDGVIDVLDLMNLINLVNGIPLPMTPGQPSPGKLRIVDLKGDKTFFATNAIAVWFHSIGDDNLTHNVGLEKAEVKYSADGKNLSASFNDTADRLISFASNNNISGYAIIVDDDISGIHSDVIAANAPCYPNPATEYVVIKNPYQTAANLIIMDAQGREISKHSVDQGEIRYNLSAMPNGTYHYYLNNGNSSLFGRFVVNK